MKKVFVVLMIMLLPLSAMAAMTSISDNELSDVTGQMGISIALVDFNMDLSIANFTYDDEDTGRIIASNRAITYGPGYLNIGPLDLKNIYITIAGNPIFTSTPDATDMALVALVSTDSTVWGAMSAQKPCGIAGDMLTIDVMSVVDSPYCALDEGQTGILIGIPDMFFSLDGIDIDGIYLDSVSGADPAFNTKIFLPYAERWVYGNERAKQDCNSLGSLHINGITVVMYSSVAGTTYIPGLGNMIEYLSGQDLADEDDMDYFRSSYKLVSTNGCAGAERYNPGNRAYLLITTHCGAAGASIAGF
jgi:hypothetical protein